MDAYVKHYNAHTQLAINIDFQLILQSKQSTYKFNSRWPNTPCKSIVKQTASRANFRGTAEESIFL